MIPPAEGHFPQFNREFFKSVEDFTVIGDGSVGGKAKGLAFIQRTLASEFPDGRFQNIAIRIPRLAVIATDLFDAFVKENALKEIAASDDPDDRIAHAFQRGSLPVRIVGDLKALIDSVRQPLAIRSSSLLEDAMFQPFAGVYSTKMIPNNQPDADSRFRKLVEAIKFVYASTYFADAKSYIRSTDKTAADEKMAVVIQEVVGRRHGDRFYPDVSGVARSYNFYPMGHAEPKDGVVHLALGLGKQIVDGGLTWSYCPAYPRTNPPYGSLRDLLRQTQVDFWAVNMGKPPAFDPIRETEYLLRVGIEDAEGDGTLRYIASTYDSESDRLKMGIGMPGPRVLDFATLLRLDLFPLNDLLIRLMRISEEAVGAPVEIEFALTLPETPGDPARFGFLQVRPMVVSHEEVRVEEEEMDGPGVLTASTAVLGNGVVEEIRDIVYCKPEAFDTARTQEIAREVERINRSLAADGGTCLLIGFGRWGSSDPWLGIPVKWGQISRARAIVEASMPTINADPSQGSHFFHNISSFRVLYFSVRHTDRYRIDWAWLARQGTVAETEHLRHVRIAAPLSIKVDGRSGRGVILRPPDPAADHESERP